MVSSAVHLSAADANRTTHRRIVPVPPRSRPSMRRVPCVLRCCAAGGVAERSKALVLKTGEGNSSQGSNPCPSTIAVPVFTP